MSGALQHAGDEGGYERCRGCGAPAVGPCARCGAPVCGDCCVLTEGGLQTFAICLRCNRAGGRSLRAGWWLVLGWLLLPMLVLLGLVLFLGWLSSL